MTDDNLSAHCVEDSWGEANLLFLPHTDHISKHLREMSWSQCKDEVLPVVSIKKYVRKANHIKQHIVRNKFQDHKDMENNLDIQTITMH